MSHRLYSSTIMHFAALVTLVVIASSVPGLAAPTPNPHPQAISKRDDSSAVYGSPPNVDLYERSPGRVPDSVKAYPYERSPGPVLDSVTTQRDGDSSKRFLTLPDTVEGYTWESEGTSSNSTKRQAYSIIPEGDHNVKRLAENTVVREGGGTSATPL
ncbi:hypothetical protein EV702DRAFT_141275 [Suillus placidus]|uniref:Uncharacterized protein n=1 Tax=Suillus placidus TaxID=48579 RepID=A0A9P6ZY03_9AGAM|nr:hypothetical protein EV702DRAFT_141275 [Suillus placidus]